MRLLLALVVAAGVILSSPFIRDIRDWIRGTFPGQYATVVATAVAISIGLALIAAIIRIRDRRALRYGAIASRPRARHGLCAVERTRYRRS